MNILVVEDDSANAKLISKLLKQEKYHVDLAKILMKGKKRLTEHIIISSF